MTQFPAGDFMTDRKLFHRLGRRIIISTFSAFSVKTCGTQQCRTPHGVRYVSIITIRFMDYVCVCGESFQVWLIFTSGSGSGGFSLPKTASTLRAWNFFLDFFYSFQNCVFFLLLVVDVPDEKKTVQKYLKKKEKKYPKSSTRRHSIVQPNFELPSVFVFFFSTHTIRPVKHPTQLYWSTRPTPTTSTISYVKSRHVPTSRRLLFRYIEKKKWFSMFFFHFRRYRHLAANIE